MSRGGLRSLMLALLATLVAVAVAIIIVGWYDVLVFYTVAVVAGVWMMRREGLL